MSRQARCVRCGRPERTFDSWLCTTCFLNPQAKIEQGIVENGGTSDYREMRRRLMADFHWYGWSGNRTEGA